MSKDLVIGIKLNVDGKTGHGELRIIENDLDRITGSIKKQGDVAEASYSKTRRGLESISSQLASARKLAEAFFAAQAAFGAVSGITRVADNYTNLSAQLKLATQSAQEFTTAQGAIAAIASRTQSPLDDLGKLYARLADSARTAGKSQNDLLKVVETVANSGKVSGASVAEMSSTITQLSQVLASGTAQWEDFGQLTDTNMRLVRTVLKGLGTDIGQLKKDMGDGKISSEQVFEAILQGYEQLKTESASMPKTVGGSIQEMSNAWELYIGKVDTAHGISRTMAEGVSALANNIDKATVVVGALAGGMAALFGASMVARIGSVSTAIKGVGIALSALARHPLIAIATVGGSLLGAKLLSDADMSRIDKLKAELADLEKQTSRPGFMGSIPGRDEGRINAIKAEIKAIEDRSAAEDAAKQASLKADQEAIDRIRQQANGNKAAEAAAKEKAKASDKAAKAAASEAEQLQSRYASAAAAMEKEIALSGNKTRATEMEWDVAQGMYQDLDDASKVRLLNLAAELDFKDKMAEASREEAEAAKAAADEYLRLYEKFNPREFKIDQNLKDVWSAADKKILSGDQLARELEKAYDVGEKAGKEAADATQKAFERAIENIQDSLAGMFKSVLNGEALTSFKDFANNIKNVLTDALSQAMSTGLINILSGKGTSGDWAGLASGALVAVGQLIGSALSKKAPTRQYSPAEQNTTPGVGTDEMKIADMFGRDLGYAFQTATVEAFNRKAKEFGTLIGKGFNDIFNSNFGQQLTSKVTQFLTGVDAFGANVSGRIVSAVDGATSWATSGLGGLAQAGASVLGAVYGVYGLVKDWANLETFDKITGTISTITTTISAAVQAAAAAGMAAAQAIASMVPVVGWIVAAVINVAQVFKKAFDGDMRGSIDQALTAGYGSMLEEWTGIDNAIFHPMLLLFNQKPKEPNFKFSQWSSSKKTDQQSDMEAAKPTYKTGGKSKGLSVQTPFGTFSMQVYVPGGISSKEIKAAFGPIMDVVKQVDINLARKLEAIDPGAMTYYRGTKSRLIARGKQDLDDMDVAQALYQRYGGIANVLGKSGTAVGKTFDAWWDTLTKLFLKRSKNNIVQVLGIAESIANSLESFMKLPVSLARLIGDSVKSVKKGASPEAVATEINGIVNAFMTAKIGLEQLGTPVNDERLVTFLAGINKIGYGVQDAGANLVLYADVLKKINGDIAIAGDELLATMEAKLAALKSQGYSKSAATAYFGSFGLFSKLYKEAGVGFKEADLDSVAKQINELSKQSQDQANRVIDQALKEAKLGTGKKVRAKNIDTLVASGKLDATTVAEAEYGVSVQKITQDLLSAMGFVQQLGFITGKSLGQMSVSAATWLAAAKNVEKVFGDLETAMQTFDAMAKAFLTEQEYAQYNLDTVNRAIDNLQTNYPQLANITAASISTMLKSAGGMKQFIEDMAQGDGELAKQSVDYIQLLMQRKEAEEALASVTGSVTGNLDDMKKAIQGAIDSMRDQAQSLRDYVKGLLSSDLSTLSPEAKLQEARAQYTSYLARAKDGDQGAINQLSGMANQYLTVAKDYFGSSSGYAQVFNEVALSMSGVADYFDANANATAAAGNAALALADSFSALKTVVDGISGWTGATNTGTPVKFRAKGGWTQGPTVINEDGPELVNFAGPSLVTNNRQTQSVIALGNQEAVGELRQQTVELRALVRLQQASINALLAKLDEGNANTADMKRRARLEATA